MVDRRRTRSTYSPAIGKARNELYRRTRKRAIRARKAGFYVETIALVESLLADRLESSLTAVTGEPTRHLTVNQATAALRNTGRFPEPDLLDEAMMWGHRRSQWVHEFVKIADEDGIVPWRQRLAQARQVADDGLELLERVSSSNARLVRRAVSEGILPSRPPSGRR